MLRLPILLLAGCLSCPAAAAVYQCVDDSGRLLLTDSPCPAGYRSNLVVTDPPPRSEEKPSETSRRHVEAERSTAEAEAAMLRAQLEAERTQNEVERERLRALDDKLDAILQRQDPSLAVIGPSIWGFRRSLPPCGNGLGRAWVDCRPRVAKSPPSKGPVKRDHALPRQDRCGIFGCTPTITHAPWDDERRERRMR